MKKLTNLFSIVILLLFIYSCKKECTPHEVSHEHLFDYGCGINQYELADEVDMDSFLIIRDQVAYDNLVNCPITGLDFSTHDIIIGKEILSSGPGNINAFTYSDNCNGNILEVQIHKGPAAAITPVAYNIIVPKIADINSLSVEVYITSD